MAALLFNSIPSTLFLPLAAPGAAYYARCLQGFYQIAKDQGEPPSRDRLIESILALNPAMNSNQVSAKEKATEQESDEDADFSKELRAAYENLENEEPLYGLDEDTPESEQCALRAGAVLRYLTRCGWLQVEMHADFTQRFVFPEAAFRLLETFSSLRGNRTTENRFQGLICSIHDLLKAACEQGQGHVRILEAENQLQALLSHLRELQHNIGHFLEKILKTESAKETLNIFFNGYSSEIMEKAYHQLKTTDHLSRYRPTIEDCLQQLNEQIEQGDRVDLVERVDRQLPNGTSTSNFTSHADSSVSGVLRQACAAWGCEIHAARIRLAKALAECEMGLATLDSLLGSIDHRHGLFVDAAVRVLERKIMGSSTVSGVVSGSLKAAINGLGTLLDGERESDDANSSKVEEQDSTAFKNSQELLFNALHSCIELTRVQHLSSDSLTKPKKAGVQFQVMRDTTKPLTRRQIAEAKAKTTQALDKNFGKERIRRIAEVLLDIRNPTLASEINIRGPEDLALLVYLRAYGTGELGYLAKNLLPSKWIRKMDVGFQDFEIKKVPK